MTLLILPFPRLQLIAHLRLVTGERRQRPRGTVW